MFVHIESERPAFLLEHDNDVTFSPMPAEKDGSRHTLPSSEFFAQFREATPEELAAYYDEPAWLDRLKEAALTPRKATKTPKAPKRTTPASGVPKVAAKARKATKAKPRRDGAPPPAADPPASGAGGAGRPTGEPHGE